MTAAANLRLLDAFDREEARRAANGGVSPATPRKPRRHRAVSLLYRDKTSGTDPPKQPVAATV